MYRKYPVCTGLSAVHGFRHILASWDKGPAVTGARSVYSLSFISASSRYSLYYRFLWEAVALKGEPRAPCICEVGALP